MTTQRTRKQAEQTASPVTPEASTLEPGSMAEVFRQMELSRQADREERRQEREEARAMAREEREDAQARAREEKEEREEARVLAKAEREEARSEARVEKEEAQARARTCGGKNLIELQRWQPGR